MSEVHYFSVLNYFLIPELGTDEKKNTVVYWPAVVKGVVAKNKQFSIKWLVETKQVCHFWMQILMV